jgi:hypothetical protein
VLGMKIRPTVRSNDAPFTGEVMVWSNSFRTPSAMGFAPSNAAAISTSLKTDIVDLLALEQ